MIKLAQSLGFDPSEGEEWFDAGWRYPWEESKRVKSAASNSAFDAIRYVDDFPEGALTIITTRDFKPEEEARLNPKRKGDNKGININDEFQDFTGQILRGEKTIETRDSRSLDSRIGKLTGIIRTGIRNQKATLVGYAVIGEPVVYDSVAKFRRDYKKHLVAPGSEHDIKNGLKYGYPLMQVKSVTPKELTSRGNVIRQLNPAKRNPATPEDFPDVSSAKMRATPQTKTDAFKKWFGDSIVVNPDGTPMVMYHGTGWTDLREFKSNRARGQISGFFAFDPEFAEDFAMIYGPDEFNADEEDELGVKKAASVYPAYLSLKKVFDVRKKEDRDAVGFKEVARGKGWDWTQLEEPSLIKKMRTLGFDGYIDFEAGSNYPPTGIAVFDPRSVKSAIGNRGTFDPTDPDIRNPASRTVDEAAKKAGYTTKAFHRTSAKFTKFIPGGPKATRQIWKTKSGESRTLFGQSGRAMWFGTSPDNLPAYHNEPTGKGVVLMVYLKNPVPLQIDDDTRDWARDVYADGSKDFPLLLSDEHIRKIRGDGYTGIEYWRKGKTAEKSSPDEIVVFNANQIKSADLVTYDDAGNSIPISNRFSGKSDDIRNPRRSMIRTKLSRILEPGDRVLDYDRAQGEDLYRLWDMVHTDKPLTKEALVEIEGMLDDDGVLVIQSGEEPSGLKDHFRRATRYQGMLLVQGPMNPEVARINTEKLRRDLE